MNLLELLDAREQKQTRANAIVNNAQKETRKLNQGEQTEFDGLTNDIKELDRQINALREEGRNAKQNKTVKKFSLLHTINDIANGRQISDEARAVIDEGFAEMRRCGQNASGQIILPLETREDTTTTTDTSILAGTATQGKENVATNKLGLLAPLRNSMVLAQAGATFLTGLVGNISIPSYSGSTVKWADETGKAENGEGSFSDVELSPKRITAELAVSKQFLIQDSNSAEAMLKADIIAAVGEKLESTILGTGAGSDKQPAGLFNGVTADTAAVTYKSLVAMESALESANVSGDIKFLVSPSAKADLKTTEKASNTAKFLMDGNEINGYPALSSSSVAGKGVIMGRFSDLVIAQWGAIDLTVDPLTLAGDGKVRIIINAYFDAKPRRSAAFQKKVLKA